MKRAALVASVLMLTGATCTKRQDVDTVFVPEAAPLTVRVMEPVDERLTPDIPCAERANETVGEISREAHLNKAACKIYRRNMEGIRNTHPAEKPQ